MGRWLAITFAYAALAVWVFRPVTWRPADTVAGVPGSDAPRYALVGDVYQDLWILGAAATQLANDPQNLFHPRAFYPERYALAFSEHLLGNQPFFAPLYLLSGNPVLAFNTTLLSTALLGLGTHLLVRHWGGSHAAALLASVLVVAAPWRVGEGTAQAHGLVVHYLPFVLLFLDRYLLGGRATNLAAAGGCLILQIVATYYAGYATMLAVAVLLLARLPRQPGRTLRAGLGLGVAVALAALASYPYVIAGIADRPTSSGAGLGRLVGTPGQLTWQRVGLFPVLMTMLLAIPGTARWGVRHRAPVGALLAVAVLGYVLALGPSLILPRAPGDAVRALSTIIFSSSPAEVVAHALDTGPDAIHIPLPYAALAMALPGFDRLRGTTRLAVLPAFALPITAAFALDHLVSLLPSLGAALLVALAAAVAALVPPAIPEHIPVGELAPPAYLWLRAHGAGRPLLDLPRGTNFTESRAMYFSLLHGLPVLNGYGSYPPDAFNARSRLSRLLPRDRAAVDALCNETGFGWVVVHGGSMGPPLRQLWESPPSPFRLVGRFGDDLVLSVDCPAASQSGSLPP